MLLQQHLQLLLAPPQRRVGGGVAVLAVLVALGVVAGGRAHRRVPPGLAQLVLDQLPGDPRQLVPQRLLPGLVLLLTREQDRGDQLLVGDLLGQQPRTGVGLRPGQVLTHRAALREGGGDPHLQALHPGGHLLGGGDLVGDGLLDEADRGGPVLRAGGRDVDGGHGDSLLSGDADVGGRQVSGIARQVSAWDWAQLRASVVASSRSVAVTRS